MPTDAPEISPPGPAAAGAPPGPRRADLTALAACVAVAFLAFLPAVRNGFVPSWDDGGFVVNNELIRRLDLAARAALGDFKVHFDLRYWAPLTLLSLALDYQLWGLSPAGFHLTNVVLHALDAGLLFLLARAILGLPAVGLTGAARRWAAALAALLWALHPLRVEAVAWVSERKGLLSMLFTLAAALAYLRHVAAGAPFWRSRWYLAAALLVAAALLSKPAAVTLPLLLVVLDAWPLRRPGGPLAPAALAEKAPLLAAAALTTWLTVGAHEIAVSTLAARPPWGRLLVSLRAVADYLRLTAWPAGLSPFYLYPGDVSATDPAYLVPAVLLVAATAAAAWWARRWPAVAAAWACFLVALAPALVSSQYSDTAMSDRYTYLPGVPLALLAAGALGRALSGRPRGQVLAAGAAAAAALALLAGWSVSLLGVWRDDRALWSRAIEVDPRGSGRIWAQRSLVREEAGDLPGAAADLDGAIAIADAKRFEGAWRLVHHRAALRGQLGEVDGALADYRRALATSPPGERAAILRERASLLRAIGQAAQAEADERAAAALPAPAMVPGMTGERRP